MEMLSCTCSLGVQDYSYIALSLISFTGGATTGAGRHVLDPPYLKGAGAGDKCEILH